MRIELDNPQATRALVRFLRGREYLAVAQGSAIVEVVPINSTTEQADRRRTLSDLEEWRAEHPEVETTVLGPNNG